MSRRDPALIVGLFAVWAAAMVASFSTLADLATSAGWHGRLAWLLPLCLDALGMSAGRVWMNPKAPSQARSYARVVTLAAVVLSIVGNAAGHMVATGYVRPGLVLVVLVGAVPPASIAAVVHLTVLVWSPVPGRRTRPVPAPVAAAVSTGDAVKASPKPEPTPKAKPSTAPVKRAPRERVPDELLLQRARHLDQQHRDVTGRPISRDKLKKQLGISTTRAGEIVEQLRAEAVA